jgi:predicted esterase
MLRASFVALMLSACRTAAPPPAPSGIEAGAGPASSPVGDHCVAAERGTLQDITSTPHAPYFVHHPDAGVADPATIVFVPGGPGSRDTAAITFERWLSRGTTLGRYRVIVPYAADGDLTDEGDRIVPILDEVLGCYGGDKARVHLAGTSNGGRAAFALMLRSPDRFATLLGAPGLFQGATDDQLKMALAGKAVFDGAGELDDEWRPLVEATNQQLVRLGIDATLVTFPGQGHIWDEHADPEPMFAFWSRH